MGYLDGEYAANYRKIDETLVNLRNFWYPLYIEMAEEVEIFSFP